MAPKYPFQEIEAKWQQRWEEQGLHRTDLDHPGKKLYSLTMFSYPSGDKLHIGHWYNYGPADTWTRFKKMQGYTVFQPQGFDAFGLPAENYAIKHGVHPAQSTAANIATMQEQLRRIGAMYDWSNYVDTSTPEYYKWTQWIFLKLFEMGLATQEEAPVNWCPSCTTVLANEQVKEGACERCGAVVVQKTLKQWFFKITCYADELLEGLDKLDWPEKTKTMQRNWIGRSEGAHITFKVADTDDKDITVFTTRPDTLYGATYMVLAPEHPLVEHLTAPECQEKVVLYRETASAQTELDRIAQKQGKTGVFTGAYVINPLSKEKIPIWIADYVLVTYGTGAIMAVPGSDERDFEFAKTFDLPIIEVVSPDGELHGTENCYAGRGISVNSAGFSGLSTEETASAICDALEKMGQGKRMVQYRLRDWLLSRQRYWGAPIPVIHCDSCGAVPAPLEDLPVRLPRDIDLKTALGEGVSPLATVESFVHAKCPRCGGEARRETDTMDTFVDSSWYFLRYVDAHFGDGPFNPRRVSDWLPVDMYIGGSEHATMHLLYARFVTKALRDGGLLDFGEPFKVLRHQGMITNQGARMSKSKGNVVSPDTFVDRYGADVFRSYLMFMGPYDEGGDWNDSGITGLSRFQDRVWRIGRLPVLEQAETDRDRLRRLHVTIRSVTNDLENMHFNTAISRLMELSNGLVVQDAITRDVWRTFVQLLGPFMPHMAEELWAMGGEQGSLFDSAWPNYDAQLCVEDMLTIGVTVNGKRRGEVSVPRDADQSTVLAASKAEPGVARHLEGKAIIKEIVVPGRVVNFVVR